jgi:hypothetical protein
MLLTIRREAKLKNSLTNYVKNNNAPSAFSYLRNCKNVCVRGLFFWGLLFIWFVYTICLYSWLDMAKVYYGVRFEPSLHSSFKVVAGASGCTVTGAFERFMRSCVEAGSLVFVEKGVLDFEVEAKDCTAKDDLTSSNRRLCGL